MAIWLVCLDREYDSSIASSVKDFFHIAGIAYLLHLWMGGTTGNRRCLLILLAHPYWFFPGNSGSYSSKPFSNPAAFAIRARLLGFT